MIKCGVCGSENEAQALFCGTCGSPLSPAEAATVAAQAKPVAPEVVPADESVVPGKGGARRDLGIGGEATKAVTTEVPTGTSTETVGTETSGFPGPSIVCGVCATVNDASRTYCRKCANELKAVAASPPPPPPVAPGRRISPTIIGLGAAGVVVAIGVGVILALGGGGPSATAPPATPALTAQVTSVPGVETPAPSQAAEPTAAPVTAAELAGRIAFARCAGDDCVLVVIAATAPTEVDEMTSPSDGSATDPAITHDGQRIAFSVPDGLRIIDVGSRDITTHSTGGGDISVSWSPNDARLTFAGHRDRDPEPPVGDREIRLDGVTVGGSSEPLTSNKVDDHDPVFTLDGQSIIWAQGQGDSRELKIIDLDSRVITNLTDDGFPDVDPAARPDQREIAFVSKRDSSDGFDLFLMDVDTKTITPLPSLPGDQHDPAWSPDGRFLVFSSGAAGSRGLFVMDVTDPTRPVLQLTTGADDTAPTWGP